jgi:hypothetical protein
MNSDAFLRQGHVYCGRTTEFYESRAGDRGAGTSKVGDRHSGSHGSALQSRDVGPFFRRTRGLPTPQVDLQVGSGPHGQQTGHIMSRLEPLLQQKRPDLVIVFGDVNSTVGPALCAAKMGIPVAHVEAGLRSFDRTMPEELNRVVTDHISEFLFTTERSGRENLLREETAVFGIPCVTLRHNTERPVTIEHGTNTLAGTSPERIVEAGRASCAGRAFRDGRRTCGTVMRPTVLSGCWSNTFGLPRRNGRIRRPRLTPVPGSLT